MPEPSPELFQYWGHSFEEDEPGTTVYRPADHPFPRARARDGLEVRSDGTAVRWRTGRGDAQEPVEGRWRVDAAGGLRLSFPADSAPLEDAAGGGPTRALDVVELTTDVLRVRSVPDGG